jgi:hypothetical protein
LKADIGAPDTWIPATLEFILERIRAEGEADILDTSASKDPWTTWPLLAGLTLQSTELEMVGKLPLRAIVRPRPSNCLIFLVGGAIPSGFELKALEDAIPNSDRHLLWYAPGIEPSELNIQPLVGPTIEPKLPAPIRFYFPPPESDSVSKLLSDYGLFASAARLQLIAASSATDYRRAGMELIAPLTGLSELLALLSLTDLPVALQDLNELPGVFKTDPEFWSTYKVDLNNWSAPEAGKAIANEIASKFQAPQVQQHALQEAIGKVITQGLNNDASKISGSPILNSTTPNANARLLLQEILERFINQRLTLARIQDKFKERLTKEFVLTLLATIDMAVTSKNVELIRIATWLPALVAELDKLRLSLKTA